MINELKLQLNIWHENNTTIQRQLVNIKKSEDKIVHPMIPLIKQKLRKRWLFLTVWLYLFIGYFIGFFSKIDLIVQIKYLFSDTMIYKNPGFWLSAIMTLILLLFPFLTISLMVSGFPLEKMAEVKEVLDPNENE